MVRIFQLHGGYRQSAAFIADVLKRLEEADALTERIQFSGTIPDTPLHYTITCLIPGCFPLTQDLYNSDSDIRAQVIEILDTIRKLSVPSSVMTAQEFMGPRLNHLNSKLELLARQFPFTVGRVGPLCKPVDFATFRMVVSHCDAAHENFLVKRVEPDSKLSIMALIDWEFVSYRPEFADALKFPRVAWGDELVKRFDHCAKAVLYTESLCMIAEDYEDTEGFKGALEIVLKANGR